MRRPLTIPDAINDHAEWICILILSGQPSLRHPTNTYIIIFRNINTGKDSSEMLIDTSEQHGCTWIPKRQYQLRLFPQLLNLNTDGIDNDYAERHICILISCSRTLQQHSINHHYFYMDINNGQDVYGLNIDPSEQHGCTWTPEHQYQLRLLPQLLNLNTDRLD